MIEQITFQLFVKSGHYRIICSMHSLFGLLALYYMGRIANYFVT